MALVTTQGFDLNPRIGQGLARGIQTLGQFQLIGQRNLQIEREAGVREALGGALAPQMQPQTEQQQMLAEQTAGIGGDLARAEQPQPVTTQEEKIELARQIDPAIANKQLKELGLDSASKRAEMSRFAAKIESLPPAQRFAEIEKRSQELDAQGRDSSHTRMLLDMDQETQDKALLGVQLMDLTTKERLTLRQTQATARAKAISLEDVKSSKILDDGTTIQVMKSGATRVTSPEGVVLEGTERAQAIKDSQEFGVDIQQRRAKGRELGKGAGKVALNAFDKVAKIRENVLDYQRGIDLIEKEGATTGFVADFLPNMKAATRKFANLRRKLGLNVVASVTFGALSEGELNLAMDVALPKGISPEATVKWIKDRMDAQQKLADNLEDAALFLADNSVAELIRRNRAMAKAGKKKAEVAPEATTAQQATPTGKTATNPKTNERLQEMSDGTWRAL